MHHIYLDGDVRNMSDTNKNNAKKKYNANKTKLFTLRLILPEYDAFNEYCTNIDVNRSAYIKKLINEDAIKRGYKPIFGSTTDGNKDDIE